MRHALPQRHRVEAGTADPGLTEEGHRQARAVADWLAREHIDAIVSSPAKRCLETAAPLAEITGLPVEIVPGLREFDSGAREYRPVEEIMAEGGPAADALRGGDYYGNVDAHAFRSTVITAATDLATANPGRRIVAFSHAGTICAWTGDIIGAARNIWFAPGYTSISRTAVSRTGARGVISVGETPHLHPAVDGAPTR